MSGVLKIVLIGVICSVNIDYLSAARIKCFQCSGVPRMEDCGHTVTCGDHEECYTRRSTGTVGNTVYESGCISKQVCQQISSIPTGKRSEETHRERRGEFVNCLQCCSGQLCNKHLCTKKPIPTNLTECFVCDVVARPEECTRTELCGQDYKCYTIMEQLHTDWELRFKLGCIRKEVCAAFDQSAPTNNLCSKCCNDNYCNPTLCGFLDKAKPVLTAKPQNKAVDIGKPITIQCLVAHIDGLPATVTWTHKLANSTVTSPPVSYSNDNQVINMTVTEKHYGYWTCTVSNKNGNITNVAVVSPPIPDFGG